MRIVSRFLRSTAPVLIVAALLAAPASAADPASGDAQSDAIPAFSPKVDRSVMACTPQYTGSFATRVHIRCSNPTTVGADTVYYWAVPTADRAEAARAMSLFITAIVTATPLYIYYDPADTSGPSIGCQTSDCRVAWGIELR